MGRFLLARILSLIPTIFGISVVVFFLLRLVPGGPAAAMLGPSGAANPENVARIKAEYGLDRPIYEQYLTWVGKAVRGDLGRSIATRLPVRQIVLGRFKNTLVLASSAALLATMPGVTSGMLSAVYSARGRYGPDMVVTGLSTLGLTTPSFALGVFLIVIFTSTLHWLPAAGSQSAQGGGLVDRLRHLVMPVATLSAGPAAIIARIARTSTLEVLGEDYVRMARAKGLSDRSILWRHVLRNASIPIVTTIGLFAGSLLGGSIIVETVFGWPGMGR